MEGNASKSGAEVVKKKSQPQPISDNARFLRTAWLVPATWLIWLIYKTAVLFLVLRIPTFYLADRLFDNYNLTVNPPGLLRLYCYVFLAYFLVLAVCIAGMVAGSYLKYARDMGMSAMFAAGAVMVSMLFELLVVPATMGSRAALPGWLMRINTFDSKAVIVRQVTVEEITLSHVFKSKRYYYSRTAIKNWQCDAPTIEYRVAFDAHLEHQRACVDVHRGLFGWDWIDSLRACPDQSATTVIAEAACPAPG